ncbi:hypothetical protein [Burkholderia pseudomallei]|uniref:hypothetical protein n=1 Tax=Burkholderia pseudomallei TaxID=28450 RepID=UPI000F0891BB|nr:hypothetical protein [Burkholderia pseudomallei]CAJ3072807.1 Uncharacterised protein [Burkholderia pseudomallei]VCK72859.1 Uncharacterised protein [Burkholderia pseudomallei]VCK79991.1 Uncharacterised protein [Burkholderia pseudomallei]VCK80026.1 Uncharacterised protein [Burkholderia pseudomallei]VCK80789.1 Uncharacterised protein [Burkholderia pseudomallei]
MSPNDFPLDASATSAMPRQRPQVDEHRLKDAMHELEYHEWRLLRSGEGDFVLSKDGSNVTLVEWNRVPPQELEEVRSRRVPIIEHIEQDAFRRASPEKQAELIQETLVESQLCDPNVYKQALEQPRQRMGLPPAPLRPELFPTDQPAPTICGRVTGVTPGLVLYIDANRKEGTIDRKHIDPRSMQNVDQLRLGDSICIDFKKGPRASLTVERTASQRAGVMHINELGGPPAPRAGGMRHGF